ncbi:MAG: SIMPL domain-containing protein [Nitrososphaera sp.]
MSDNTTNKRQMLALIAGILAIGLVAASIIGGHVTPSAQAQQNSDDDPMPVDLGCETGAEVCEPEIQKAIDSVVSTPGTATVKVTPDKVSVTIGVETRGETAEEAAAANAELMDKVLEALKNLGIDEDQMSTSWYNVWPVYEWTSPPCIEIFPQPPECAPRSVITGYAASNSVTVTLDADDDVGKVIDGAVAAGATNVNGAYFFVSSERQEEIRQNLIADAIANARSRAEKAAEAVSMEITGVKSINLNDVYFPVFYKELAQAADGGSSSSTPILPGQQEISMTVQVTFRMS